MRSRRSANYQVAEVARRRLAQLSAELAEIRREPAGTTEPAGRAQPDGSGEPSPPTARPGRHAHRALPVADLAGGWLHDRLPATLQGRVQIGSSHLSAVAVLVAVALAVTAWWALGSRGSVRPVPAAAPVSSPSALVSSVPAAAGMARTTTTAAASASPTGSIVVDVAGKVRHPGIATLPAGSRVVDALREAGGARRGVDLSGLNLARLLVDGEQILVGARIPGGVAASAASGSGASATTPVVDINTADQTQLEALPGVGPVTATAILQWRAENGSFASVDQLLDVNGIGDATLAQLAPFVTL